MCEVLLLVSMCRYLNRVATAKGRSGVPFVILMVVAWIAAGMCGAVIGYLAAADTGVGSSLGAFLGYVAGVVLACIGMSVIVNSMTGIPSAHEWAAVSDERAYIEWRKRHGTRPAKAKVVDEEEEEAVVDLQPADAPPPPRAQRAWKRKEWDDR